MLDPSLANNPSAAERRKAVREYVEREVADGTFTLTETMLRAEPLRSDSNEVLDGVVVENDRSMKREEALETEPVKLVHVNPDGVIQYRTWQKFRIPGTTREVRRKVNKIAGNFANVPNTAVDRDARNIMYQYGWPILQFRQEHGHGAEGSVIEWRWFEREARKPDALPEYVELYNEIRSRPGFLEFIGEAPRARKTESKSTQQATAP